MAGWIKIHRGIANHWIFQDAEKFKWWMDMLFLASYEDNRILVGNRIVEIKRGQFQGSLSFFMKRWRVSKDRVINFLKLLQSDGMIIKESDRNIPLITICNYESYQDIPDSLPDNLPDNPPDNLPDTTKEVKEVKEYISKTTTAPAYAREEDDFISRYRREGMWQDVAMILHKPVSNCEQLFDRWILEFRHKGQTHRDYTDFKSHFIQWSRITISKEDNKQNGSNRQDYSRRGRADVPADISLDF